MAYATTADVQNAAGGLPALVALADFAGTTNGALDGAAQAVIDDAIATADGLIDSYLHKRFAVPIAAPPRRIVKLSARLAVFDMRSSRNTTTDADMVRHEADIKWLEDVRDGKQTPGVEPLPPASSLEVDQSGTRPSSKEVSRNRLKGFW